MAKKEISKSKNELLECIAILEKANKPLNKELSARIAILKKESEKH